MSLALVGLALTCMPYGPAHSRENLLKYKFFEEIRIEDGYMSTQSVNEIAVYEKWKFRVVEDRTDACPGTILGKATDGTYGALKGLYTDETGVTRGILIFDDAHGERFKALVECKVSVNPACTYPGENIPGWEVF